MLMRLLGSLRFSGFALLVPLSGCVFGHGHCLFTEPVKNSLIGTLHFRTYPVPDGIDHVPVLVLDQTAYIYSPWRSFSCFPANEVQLIGVSEFPEDVDENSRLTVRGSLAEGVSSQAHTQFVFNVLNIDRELPPRP